MEKIANYINGEFVEPTSRAYLDNVDPATGGIYSLVPDSDEQDVERATQAAQAAFPAWSQWSADQRCRMLLKIADRIEADLEPLARAECVDNGKPLSLARSIDIPRAATNFRFFATAILHARSECHPMDRVALNYTLRRPRGVAGIISPWNLPLYLFSWKVAPALATGNTVVAKPSEITPMTAFLLCKICEACGLPPGVLNVVHGLGPQVGAAIVAHPRIPTVSFTGGTETGREIARVAAPMFKKIGLELGGKNPNIILADADLDAAIKGTLRSSFLNQGQICLAGSRIFVQWPVYEPFVARLAERALKLQVGDPLEAETDQGAVVSKAHLQKICRYLELAKAEGGEIHCGGGPATDVGGRCKNGFFVQPTVITGIEPECKVNQEEIFGPVVTVTPFADEDEVVAAANATSYGLSASIWTQDLTRAHRLAERIECGTVWVNCWLLRDLRVPFGGTKGSGVGREGGEEAMRFYTEPKNVCIKT
ncbi:MAG: aldehyde dehydrogenase [Phycisphaerae bacterium]